MRPAREPHPHTVTLTTILVKLDMADWPNGPPSASEQRLSWERAMADAEKEVTIARDGQASSRDGGADAPVNALSELL